MDIIWVTKKNHTYMTVDSFESSVLAEVAEYFKFRVPNYKFMPSYRNKTFDGYIRLYNRSTKELYVGLFRHLEKFAMERGYEIRVTESPLGEPRDPLSKLNIPIEDIKAIPLSIRGEVGTFRDYQLDAIHHALTHTRCLLLSPTASGKSAIAYGIIRWMLHHTDKKVLVVVPTVSLTQQMVGDFKDYSSMDPTFDGDSICHIIQGGREKDSDQARIYVSTWQSIFKLPESWFRQFSVIIGDEAHLFQAKSLTEIMKKASSIPYRYGMSGTLSGAKTHELVLEGQFGPIHQVTKTIDLMNRGDLAELDISILVLKHTEEMRKKHKKATYVEEIAYLVKSESRNRFITNLAIDLKGNTLVLFQYVEHHGKPLHKIISEKVKGDRRVFYVSGETDSEMRESIRHITENEKDAIIVASVGTFSTGINIRNLHNIIFAAPSKSQIRVLQSIGRGLRKSDNGEPTKLYDIVDDLTHRKRMNFTLKHGIERVRIYTKERFKHKTFEVEL